MYGNGELTGRMIRVYVPDRCHEVIGTIGKYDLNAGLAKVHFDILGESDTILRSILEIERHKENGLAIIA